MGRGAGDAAVGIGDAASMGGYTLSAGGMRTNSAGDSHCYHCGAEDHWANECPELAGEQQAQPHMTMTVEGNKEEE